MTKPSLTDHDESDLCLLATLRQRGIEHRVYPHDRWSAARGLRPWIWFRIDGQMFLCTLHSFFHLPSMDAEPIPVNGDSREVTVSKQSTRDLLRAVGVPVPLGACFPRDQFEQALIYAADIPGLVCVKPDRGSLGDLVFPGLRNAVDIVQAIQAVLTDYEAVVIEQSVPGEVYRFFYVEPGIVAVKVSHRANVVGNGRDSVEALIHAENARRDQQPAPGLYPIPFGHGLDFMLAQAGYTLAHILDAGQVLELNPVSNTLFGSTSRSGMDLVHPDYLPVMARACQTVPGMRIGAVDVMLSDPMAPPDARNMFVLEVNSVPGFVTFHHPQAGPPVDIAGHILDLLARSNGIPA